MYSQTQKQNYSKNMLNKEKIHRHTITINSKTITQYSITITFVQYVCKSKATPNTVNNHGVQCCNFMSKFGNFMCPHTILLHDQSHGQWPWLAQYSDIFLLV